MAKVQPEAFISAERAISNTLTKSYLKKAKKFIEKISARIETGDYDGARERVENDVNLNGVFWQNRKRLRLLSEISMKFGASRLAEPEDIQLSTDDPLLKNAVGLLKLQVKQTEDYTKAAAFRAIDAVESGRVVKSKAEKVKDFTSFVDRAAGKVGFTHLQLVTSLHNSRLAQYGYTVEAQITGVNFYALNAILDGRTSDICRTLNGKVFPVDYAYEFSQKVLAVEDPDELKYIAPWPTGAEALETLKRGDTSELMSKGWAVPPFHPYCRTFIDEAGQVKTINFDLGETATTPLVSVTDPIEKPTVSPIIDSILSRPLAPPSASTLAIATPNAVIDGGDALNIWAVVPALTLLEIEEVIAAIRAGVDDLEIIETFNISREELTRIFDLIS